MEACSSHAHFISFIPLSHSTQFLFLTLLSSKHSFNMSSDAKYTNEAKYTNDFDSKPIPVGKNQDYDRHQESRVKSSRVENRVETTTNDRQRSGCLFAVFVSVSLSFLPPDFGRYLIFLFVVPPSYRAADSLSLSPCPFVCIGD